MKVEFNVKYGKNVIEIPIEEGATPKHRPYGKTNKFIKKVTIYNDIDKTAVEERHWDRFVIEKCLIYNGFSEGTDGTVQTISNSQNVITRDVSRYKPPSEYILLPVDEREKYFTVQIDDFVVFGEVEDEVTSAAEWRDLQDKYSKNGMSITTVNPYVFGTAVDNITMTNA